MRHPEGTPRLLANQIAIWRLGLSPLSEACGERPKNKGHRFQPVPLLFFVPTPGLSLNEDIPVRNNRTPHIKYKHSVETPCYAEVAGC
jgi:hypothetical protein